MSTPSTLTEQQIAELCTRYASGETQKELAQAYGITQPAVSNIVNGYRHSHIVQAPVTRQCVDCGAPTHSQHHRCIVCVKQERYRSYRAQYEAMHPNSKRYGRREASA